jgi:putative transposase
MPRKPKPRSNDFPYHLTARTNNRDAFHCPLDRVWRIMLEGCAEIKLLYESEIHALVLMPNHFHMLMTTPCAEIGVVMKRFMQSVTASINRFSNRTGRVFSGRYHGSLINSEVYFAHAYIYVLRNPVRAGLSSTVDEYPFSTLRFQLGSSRAEFPLHYPFGGSSLPLLPQKTDVLLNWLNRPTPQEQLDAIRIGLRKGTLTSPTEDWMRTLRVLNSNNFDAPSINKESDPFKKLKTEAWLAELA